MDESAVTKPRITVSVGGNFVAVRRIARLLAAAGSLERLVTFTPWSRLADMRGFEQQVVSFGWLGYVNFALSRTPGLRSLFVSRYYPTDVFDRCAARHLGECNALLGFCGAMLHSLRFARARGIATMVYSGSMHVTDQREIIDTECRALGLRPILTPLEGIAKADAELDEVDAVIVPSRLIERSMVAHGVDARKIRVIPEPLSRPLPLMPRQSSQPFTVIAVGMIGVRKGTHHLLEAVARMAPPRPAVMLVGGVEPGYERVLRRFDGLYTLAGRVSDQELAQAYSDASVFVLPSIEDGWGHVAVEAMTAGLPVIISDHAGSADLVSEGETGFVVPSRNPEAIRHRLEFFRDCPERGAAMGRAAQQRAATLTPEAQVNSILRMATETRLHGGSARSRVAV
jgi:glycosyltransferase involved in cell wall biosynthesis